MFPLWLKAAFWGLVGGSALLLGSAVGYYAKIPEAFEQAHDFAGLIVVFGFLSAFVLSKL
ncbi:MAG: hypothetical protein RMY34_29570 [Aulosira sp. DedQUE10]|nr:hypothetical protein [Aulosira sp. DedQUE10]